MGAHTQDLQRIGKCEPVPFFMDSAAPQGSGFVSPLFCAAPLFFIYKEVLQQNGKFYTNLRSRRDVFFALLA